MKIGPAASSMQLHAMKPLYSVFVINKLWAQVGGSINYGHHVSVTLTLRSEANQ
jgi:hypothetical protein